MLGQGARKNIVCRKGFCNFEKDFVCWISCSYILCLISNIEGNAVLMKERCYFAIHSLEPDFDPFEATDCLVRYLERLSITCCFLFSSSKHYSFSHIILTIVFCAFINATRLSSSFFHHLFCWSHTMCGIIPVLSWPKTLARTPWQAVPASAGVPQ